MSRTRSTGSSGYINALDTAENPTEVTAPEFTLAAMRTGGVSTQDASNKAIDSKEKIACRAYELYQQSGCMQGRCNENWAQAERDLSKRSQGGA